MDEKKRDERKRENTIPEAKRRDREGVEPQSQPGEFASDDTPPNRFTPAPEPKDSK